MSRSGFLGLLLVLVLAPGAPHAAQTIEYVALVNGGKQAGHQIVVHGDDGVTRVDYLFKDNGRGPELKEEYTLAAEFHAATRIRTVCAGRHDSGAGAAGRDLERRQVFAHAG